MYRNSIVLTVNKVVALLLVFCLLFVAIPVMAFAQQTDEVNTSEGKVKLVVPGSESFGQKVYQPEGGTKTGIGQKVPGSGGANNNGAVNNDNNTADGANNVGTINDDNAAEGTKLEKAPDNIDKGVPKEKSILDRFVNVLENGVKLVLEIKLDHALDNAIKWTGNLYNHKPEPRGLNDLKNNRLLGFAGITGTAFQFLGGALNSDEWENTGKAFSAVADFSRASELPRNINKAISATRSIRNAKDVAGTLSAVAKGTAKNFGKISKFTKATGVLAVVGGAFELIDSVPRVGTVIHDKGAEGLITSKEGRSATLDTISGLTSVVGGTLLFFPPVGTAIGGVLLGVSALASGLSWANKNWDTITHPEKWGPAIVDTGKGMVDAVGNFAGNVGQGIGDFVGSLPKLW